MWDEFAAIAAETGADGDDGYEAALAGLEAGAEYEFRASVRNSEGHNCTGHNCIGH